MTTWIAACGGFLMGVVWMDLLFDVQVLRHRGQAEVPERTLDSIAGYYRRVTTDARPLGHLVGGVMLLGVLGAVLQLAHGTTPRPVGIASLLLVAAPAALAARRVLPAAMRLGAREGTIAEQSDLARAICRDHLLCFGAMLALVLLQLWAGAR